MNKKAGSLLIIFILLVSMSFASFSGVLKVVKGDGQSSGSNGDRSSWPMFQGDLTHAGESTSNAPLTNQTLWMSQTGLAVESSPAVVEGVVYVGSEDGRVYAFNASTGNILWDNNLGSLVDSSPAVAGGIVYIGSESGAVYALDASDGAQLWNYSTSGIVVSSPAVAGGIVYIRSIDGILYALNATNGAEIWNYATGEGDGGMGFSSPAVANGVVYVGSDNNCTYALNDTDGAILWSFIAGGEIAASPSVVNGIVYIGSEDGYVYSLNATNGDKIWAKWVQESSSGQSVANGIVYIVSNGIYALNSTNGVQLWSNNNLGGVSSPAVGGGVIYFGSGWGNFYALNAYSGNLLWSYTTGDSYDIESSPGIAGGIVYVGSGDGRVFAFGSTGGSPIQNPSVSRIIVSPVNNTVKSGELVNFVATAFDSNGDSWDVTSSAVWTISTGAGGLWSGATYTSDNSGTWTVTASYSDVQGSTQLTVINSSVEATLSVVLSGTQNGTIVVNNGTLFSVDIRIDNASNIMGWSSGLRWNPSFLQLVNFTEGPFLRDSSPTLFIVPFDEFNNVNGYLEEINDIVIGRNGVSGSGVLATLVFQAVGIGNGSIALANIDGAQQLVGPLKDGNSNSYTLLPFNVSNCSFSVLSTLPNVDFCHNGMVDFRDIVYFVDAYIQYCQYGTLNPVCDLNHDGKLDFSDLQLFVEAYMISASLT